MKIIIIITIIHHTRQGQIFHINSEWTEHRCWCRELLQKTPIGINATENVIFHQYNTTISWYKYYIGKFDELFQIKTIMQKKQIKYQCEVNQLLVSM